MWIKKGKRSIGKHLVSSVSGGVDREGECTAPREIDRTSFDTQSTPITVSEARAQKTTRKRTAQGKKTTHEKPP